MTNAEQEQVAALANDPSRLEALCREKLAGTWNRADVLPTYPACTATVCEILSAIDYAVDPLTVELCIKAGYLPEPLRRQGSLRWTATDIVRLQTTLETRRRWAALSELHRQKLSCYERMVELAIACGPDEAAKIAADENKFTTEDLLLMLVAADDRNERLALFAALRRRLESNTEVWYGR